MAQDQRAAWHLVPSHGALSSGLAAHALHGPGAIAPQGGDGITIGAKSLGARLAPHDSMLLSVN
jgi:hypothetical protein